MAAAASVASAATGPRVSTTHRNERIDELPELVRLKRVSSGYSDEWIENGAQPVAVTVQDLVSDQKPRQQIRVAASAGLRM